MTIEKAIVSMYNLNALISITESEHESVRMAIEALEKTSDKDCSRCKDKNCCSIHDNFNIDYCSDWRV